MRRKTRKLVVVSNRGPYRQEGTRGQERWVRSAGGLVTALDPVLQQRGGVWVSAKPAEDFDTVRVPKLRLKYDLAHVSLGRGDQGGFYEGVSNAVIWPVLHNLPPTIHVWQAPWPRYVNANQRFAKLTLGSSRPADLIWVQDYQLMLVPGLLRSKRSNARIGWFCHAPWPPADMFGILPWRRQILEGLLGSDLIGFHIKEYADHFLECARRFTDYKVSGRAVHVAKRKARVIVAPIGIPVHDFQTLAHDPKVEEEAERLRSSMRDRQLVLGVDRLDYTKGIPERLAAFERLLRRDRTARSRCALVQVMVPSRTDVKAYEDLKNEVDRLVGDINGRYSEPGWIPIHYFYGNLSQQELFGYYRAADVALVTPLRDGMNLVTHEYVAARAEEDGVLVLSEFAGAAKHLKGAVLVNPYDVDSVALAIRDALQMEPTEMRRRMRALRSEVLKLDVHLWADRYIEALEDL